MSCWALVGATRIGQKSLRDLRRVERTRVYERIYTGGSKAAYSRGLL